MARIDSLLSIVAQQGANELRLGTDREPKMFAYGTAKKLSIPKTPEDTLRELLGDILTSDREFTMRARGRFELSYDAAGIGAFLVTLYKRDKGFDVVFLKKAGADTPKSSKSTLAGSVSRIKGAEPAGEPLAEPRPPSILPLPGPGEAAPSELTIGTVSVPAAPVHAAPVHAAPVHEPLPEPMALDATSSAALRVAAESRSPLAQLVAAASLLRASDLHLADGEIPTVRVHGALRRLDRDAPIDIAPIVGLEPDEQDQLEKERSVDLVRELAGIGRVRVHAFCTSAGLAAAVRLLPRAAPTLSSLNLPVPLDDLVTLPNGLVIVCGATGSGKSTTLAALAQEALRRRSVVLTTLEDPIELTLTPSEGSLVRRRQIGRDVDDFATGLRDALREDPDVLLVGEMRDPDTIGLALTAAETGHLVLASLHSRSAASAIERIVDAYPPERAQQVRVQLADSLRAVVAQRLLPRARGGRVPAVELLRVTHAVAALIREGRTAQIASAIQSGKREGMITLERSLADRVQAGEVRAEDAEAAANDVASLKVYLAE